MDNKINPDGAFMIFASSMVKSIIQKDSSFIKEMFPLLTQENIEKQKKKIDASARSLSGIMRKGSSWSNKQFQKNATSS